jgi:nitrogen fixation protein
MSDIIDINVNETIEEVTINVTDNLITVNINKITGGGGGTQTLAETLVLGNITDGENISISNGDAVILDNGSMLKKGTIDAGNGGLGGIAQICGLGYEHKWEAGRLYITNSSGNVIREVSYNFTEVPTATDDVTKGFVQNTRWILDNGDVYLCTDPTEDAAVWELQEFEQVNADWDATSGVAEILNKPTIPAAQVNSDWNAVSGVAQILNKPTIPDVSTLVPYTGANANVDLGEYELKAGQIELDTTPTGTAGVAVTRWNDTIGSSETTLKGGSVILKNGVDLVARVVNKVSPNTTLTKAAYQVVKVSGAQGQRLAVNLAQANNDLNSADTLGIVTETIAANQEGFIITVGQLEGINTTGSLQSETWSDGDVLYLSPTTAGRITNIKPNGSTGHIVIIGYVEYAHANNGKIYVKIMNGWELDELHNVFIDTPLNNQGLVYETSTDLWKNKTIDKTFVGLGNVDNTSDANKPVSTAQQTAIDAKVADSITDGVTTIAPSQNAVFDALALKQAVLSYTPYKNIQTSQTVHTGTTSESPPLFTATIPATAFSSTDIIRVLFGANKTTALGTYTLRLRINTTNTVVGAPTIATYSGTATAQVNIMQRNFNLNGGNLYGFAFTSSTLTDIIASGQTLTSTTLNPANQFFIFATIQLANASDSIIGNMLSISN